MKAKDYSEHINTKHGKLLIQEIHKKHHDIKCMCLCDCGNLTSETDLRKLLNGKVNSCKSCSNKLNGDKGRTSRSKTSKYNK